MDAKPLITLILPYYSQKLMLLRQLEEMRGYPRDLKVIIVDDGTPPPNNLLSVRSDLKLDGIRIWTAVNSPSRLSVYRINDNIPWNRSQARNLGAYVADTEWIIQADIDHILPAECAERLLDMALNARCWYRFPRFRVGKADETRRKDEIPDSQDFGAIKPHQDGFLITRKMFLSSPYDERYSGCLGGGTPFLTIMEQTYGAPKLLPPDICLHVYTSDKVKDASITTLSRDTSEYARRRQLFGDIPPTKMLLHPWHKVL